MKPLPSGILASSIMCCRPIAVPPVTSRIGCCAISWILSQRPSRAIAGVRDLVAAGHPHARDLPHAIGGEAVRELGGILTPHGVGEAGMELTNAAVGDSEIGHGEHLSAATLPARRRTEQRNCAAVTCRDHHRTSRIAFAMDSGRGAVPIRSRQATK